MTWPKVNPPSSGRVKTLDIAFIFCIISGLLEESSSHIFIRQRRTSHDLSDVPLEWLSFKDHWNFQHLFQSLWQAFKKQRKTWKLFLLSVWEKNVWLCLTVSIIKPCPCCDIPNMLHFTEVLCHSYIYTNSNTFTRDECSTKWDIFLLV